VFAGDASAITASPNGAGGTQLNLPVTGTISLLGFAQVGVTDTTAETLTGFPNLSHGNSGLEIVANNSSFDSAGPDYNTWAMNSPLGPEPFFVFPGTENWHTTGGIVGFASVSGPIVVGGLHFGALTVTTPVPEPNSFILLGALLGAVLCGAGKRRVNKDRGRSAATCGSYQPLSDL